MTPLGLFSSLLPPISSSILHWKWAEAASVGVLCNVLRRLAIMIHVWVEGWPSFVGKDLGFLVVFRQSCLLTCLVSKNTVHGMRKKKTLKREWWPASSSSSSCSLSVWLVEIISHKQTSWKQLFVSTHFLCYFLTATIITTKTTTMATTTGTHWWPPLTKRLEPQTGLKPLVYFLYFFCSFKSTNNYFYHL